MKKILITGANSYIGTSFEKWVKQWPDAYKVETVDMIDGTWSNKDFSEFDVVFHVAGIAHVSTDPKMEELYYKVNRDLTIEVAKKAKNEGVKQFIFMSSIIVYGDSSHINKKRVIDKNTVPTPSNFYGISKLQAEEGILPLQDDNFDVVVIRPPMIFGKGSKGNYPKLAKMAQKLPIFPDIKNERSMLHIDNLCEFIKLMIVNEENGVFYPQNDEYVGTSELVKLIAGVHGKRIVLTRVFNPALRLIGNFVGQINKAFGNLVYEKSMSEYKVEYRVRDLKEAVRVTEVETERVVLQHEKSSNIS
ncbi:NAD-dependent epimerase/dehydratase family protein [Clostridium carnis]